MTVVIAFVTTVLVRNAVIIIELIYDYDRSGVMSKK